MFTKITNFNIYTLFHRAQMIIMFFLISGSLQAQKPNLFAASCHKDGGRCSGDAYCTACKNCSGCKNCNSGGTCGVCTSYATPAKTLYKKPAHKSVKSFKPSATTTTKTVKGNNSASNKTSRSTAPINLSDDLLHVVSEKLSLRDGPGNDYPIIEQLKKGDTLQFVGYDGEWVQVIATESKNIGYVKLQFVK